MVTALVVITAVVAVLVLAILLWFFKIRDPLKGEDFYKFHVERKWPWELTLTPEQEKAFMAGLEAFDDSEGGCHPRRDEGILHVYAPGMLVSLFALTQHFAELGTAAERDPAGAVRTLLARAARSEADGVLHISDDWMGGAGDIDGMDKDRFSGAVMSATFAPHEPSQTNGAGYADEDSGFATTGVLRAMPGVEQSEHLNTVMFCYRRLVEHYRATRPRLPRAEPEDVLSVVMARMLDQGMPGCTWARPPSKEQHQAAIAVLSGR